MRHKKTYIWAYIDGEKLVEVIRAALDNNMMVDDLKKKLIEENPGHEITFRVVKKQEEPTRAGRPAHHRKERPNA